MKWGFVLEQGSSSRGHILLEGLVAKIGRKYRRLEEFSEGVGFGSVGY